MGLFQDPDGLGLVSDYVTKEVENVARTLKEEILIDDVILSDAYVHAANTIEFHLIEKVNHYKEAGHMAYWINHLKPVRVTLKTNYLRKLAELLGAQPASPEPPTRSNLNASLFPINEHVALMTAIRIIEYAENKNIQELIRSGKPQDAQAIQDKLSATLTKIQHESNYTVIIGSLKRHVYSPRGLATMMHGIFC